MVALGPRIRANDPDINGGDDDAIDPNLCLRANRTAASTIAESVADERRIHRRRTRIRRLWGGTKGKQKTEGSPNVVGTGEVVSPTGRRRNIYVNVPLAPQDRDKHGEPVQRYVRNKVRTTSA